MSGGLPKGADITGELGLFLRELLAGGFTLPFHVVALGVNGALVLGRYDGEPGALRCAILVEHLPDGRFGTPVNIVVTDCRGQAARLMVSGDRTAASLH